MIKIKLGASEATLVDRLWSSSNATLQRMLQAHAEGLAIHGGTPDVEQAIVEAASESFPLEVVYRDTVEPGEGADNIVF